MAKDRTKQKTGFQELIETRGAVNPDVAEIIHKNIETLREHQKAKRQARPASQKFADAVTAMSGSMPFVTFHAILFTFWILANAHLFGLKPFDPFPYGLLTTIVSLEAIFLSIFVLISQNHMQAESDKRAELDLQINLLTEYEVTRLLRLLDPIAQKLGIDPQTDPELKTLEQETNPEQVVQELETDKK